MLNASLIALSLGVVACAAPALAPTVGPAPTPDISATVQAAVATAVATVTAPKAIAVRSGRGSLREPYPSVEAVQMGDLVWTIEGSGDPGRDLPTYPGRPNLKPAGRHIYAIYTTGNMGKAPLTAEPPMLADEAGRLFAPITERLAFDPPQAARALINPGMAIKATIAFDVPWDAHGHMLVVGGAVEAREPPAFIALGS